jgi:hypothetical protein
MVGPSQENSQRTVQLQICSRKNLTFLLWLVSWASDLYEYHNNRTPRNGKGLLRIFWTCASHVPARGCVSASQWSNDDITSCTWGWCEHFLIQGKFLVAIPFEIDNDRILWDCSPLQNWFASSLTPGARRIMIEPNMLLLFCKLSSR